MSLHMQQVVERLLGQFNKRETLSHMQRLQSVLPRHHDTLFSMELGWIWHKFPDVAIWHRMLPMIYADPSCCQHVDCNKCRCQRYGNSTAYSCPHHGRVAHPRSGRPYSKEKPPTLENLYYYAESIQKRTGAEEEDQQQVGK